MARKVSLSFLGTTNYATSNYIIEEKEPIESRFIQTIFLNFKKQNNNSFLNFKKLFAIFV